jgi:hypothetical protein
LLAAWFAIAVVSWAPTTVRETRPVLDRDRQPDRGEQLVGDTTVATIDARRGVARACGIGG